MSYTGNAFRSCLLLLLISGIHVPVVLAQAETIDSFQVMTEKSEYWRYELVKVVAGFDLPPLVCSLEPLGVEAGTTLAANAASNTPLASAELVCVGDREPRGIKQASAVTSTAQGNTLTGRLSLPAEAAVIPNDIIATIWKGERLLATVGNKKSIPLSREGDRWVGYWPIPFNPSLGNYKVKVSVFQPNGNTLNAVGGFKIKGREPYALPKGFSVVTYEGAKKGPECTPPLLPEGNNSWTNLIQWTDFMGADAFWQCIGASGIWGKLKPELFPWSPYSLKMMKKAGELAHATGLKYGAYLMAFMVMGDQIQESGYTFTTGLDKKTNTLHSLRYVSLSCDKRIEDIISLLKQFEADPNVDFMGMDYMRTDFGGYEFVDDFVRDMSIPTPPEWASLTAEARSLWMGNLIEITRDPAARDQWEWWRAHKVGLVIERIVAEVKPTKPIWVFSLGWLIGHEHGQDLLMMLDAGISFNSPMFYSISKENYPAMLKTWKNYLSQGKASVVIGQCVDWNLLGRTTNPASPQEHLNRQMMALKELGPAAKHFGLFWHDLARAHFGARGPYGSMEWMMAGATSFSRFKAQAGRYSYSLTLNPPAKLIPGAEAELQVEIKNNRETPLSAVTVEFVPMPRLFYGQLSQRVTDLAPGQIQTVTLRFKTDQVFAKNGGYQMVAVKVHCPDDGPRNPWYDFVYVPVATPEIAVAGGNTPTVSATVINGTTPTAKTNEGKSGK